MWKLDDAAERFAKAEARLNLDPVDALGVLLVRANVREAEKTSAIARAAGPFPSRRGSQPDAAVASASAATMTRKPAMTSAS